MKMKSSNYSQVVTDIYDASLDPLNWNKCANSISDFVNADTAIFFYLDDKIEAKDLIASYNVDMHTFNELYINYYINIDPWNEPLLKHPEGSIANHIDMGIDMHDFVKTEYFNDFWKRAGLHHTSGGRLDINGSMCMFGAHRRKDKNPFSKEDLARFQTLVPHIKRSLTLDNDYISTQEYTEFAPELFLRANVGFIGLDYKLNITQTNEIAENVFIRGDGLLKLNRKLTAINTADNLILQQELEKNKKFQPVESPNLIYISRKNNITSYAMNIIPATTNSELIKIDPKDSAYFIFIIDPDHAPNYSIQSFSTHYKLSIAETKVLNGLIFGLTLSEISDENNVSKETIRTHIKSCFHKTLTHSQAQLINKALKECLPF